MFFPNFDVASVALKMVDFEDVPGRVYRILRVSDRAGTEFISCSHAGWRTGFAMGAEKGSEWAGGKPAIGPRSRRNFPARDAFKRT
jgi:hypothetical protein